MKCQKSISPRRESVNLKVLTLRETGFLQKLHKKWWYDKGECPQDLDGQVRDYMEMIMDYWMITITFPGNRVCCTDFTFPHSVLVSLPCSSFYTLSYEQSYYSHWKYNVAVLAVAATVVFGLVLVNVSANQQQFRSATQTIIPLFLPVVSVMATWLYIQPMVI